MDRPVDFFRDRHMLCDECGANFVVDLEWLGRWDYGKEKCPGCGVGCEAERAPRVTVDPNDPALDDIAVTQFAWYHTTTVPDWPSPTFDPAGELTQQTVQMMGGPAHVEAWAARQKAKALHLGTYEAAIYNMLRRIDDQGDRGKQFYLYRVHLARSVALREGWVIDPSNFMGDVDLAEVRPPGVDVVRYLNYHEDPGCLSLALSREQIASTQRLAILPSLRHDSDWVGTAVAELQQASATAPPSPQTARPLGRRQQPSPRTNRAQELLSPLVETLPAPLRDNFESATFMAEGEDPESWARYVANLHGMIAAPERIFAALDREAAADPLVRN